MNALEQSIRDLCAKHDLHSVTIGLLLPNDARGHGWNVGVQRWEGDRPIGCWSSNGASIAAALSETIAQVHAEGIALADEPLTEMAA